MTATRCKMDSRLIALFSNCISKNRQRINKKKANNKWQSLWQKYANSNNSEWKIDRGGEGGEGEESEEDPVPILSRAKKKLGLTVPTCCYSSIENRFSRPQGQLGHIRIHIHDMHTTLLILPFYSHPLITHSLIRHLADSSWEPRATQLCNMHWGEWKSGQLA